MKKILIILLLFIIPAIASATTPIISSVNGTVATGQTLTITGSNMVDENTANWSSFFQGHPNASGFEGSSINSDGYTLPNQATLTSPVICNPGPGRCFLPVYDTSIKLMGNQSIKFHIESVDNTETNVASNIHMNSLGITQPADVWVRFYARWDSTTGILADGHLKMIVTYGSGVPQQYVQPFPKLIGILAKDNGGTAWSNPPLRGSNINYSHNLQLGRWYLFEIEWKSTPPYVFDVYIEGQRVINSIPSISEPFTGLMIGITNASMANSNAEMDHWWDDFAVSTTRIYGASKIEISNNSTYGQGTVKYQAPIYLSDSSIQIKADLTGLGRGPYYLWVTNNRQERSSVYALSGGGHTPK